MNAMELIQGYGRLLATSEQMLAAAELSHWDELVELEFDRRQLVAALTAETGTPLTETQRAQKRDLINRILELDGKVKVLTQSWMGEMQVILTSVQAQRKLNKAYAG